MVVILINVVQFVAGVLSIAIIVDVFLSYFLPPYHKIRYTLDRFVYPMMNPIRRFVPPLAGIDFSPFILLLIIQLLQTVLINILVQFI